MSACARRLLAPLALLIATPAGALEPPNPAAPDAALIRVVDREGFTTNSDQIDVYQSRLRPRFQRPSGPTAPSLNPPLPVRRDADVPQPQKPLPGEAPSTAEASPDDAETLRYQGRYREAEPLLRRNVERLEKGPARGQPEMALGLDRHALVLQKLGRGKEAEPLYAQAIAILEKTVGPEHPDTARCLNDLAMFYIEDARYAEAEALAKRALAIREKALGPNHPDTARSLDTTGALHLSRGRFAEAEAPLQRALAIREKALGADHPDTAQSVARLAALRHRQDRISEAEPLARRALAIRDKVLGPEHPDTALSLERITGLLVHKKQYDEAETLAKRVVAIREKMLGPEHPETILILDRMAALYMLRRKFDLAEEMAQRTLDLRVKTLGPEHPDVAKSYELMGNLNVYRDRNDLVVDYYRRALAIQEKAYGPEDERIADNLSSLAYHTRNPAEAEALHKRALAIQTKASGPAHPKTIEILTTLLNAYQRQQRFADALALGEKLLADIGTGEGQDAASLVKVLDTLADIYNPSHNTSGPRRRPGDALPLLRRALAIREKMIGPDHVEIIERQLKLASISVDIGQIAEAEEFNKRALAASERGTGPASGTTAFLTARVARFYKDRKKYPEAEQYFRRYIDITEQILRKNASIATLSSDMFAFRELMNEQRRSGEMEPVYKRLLSVSEQVNTNHELEHCIFLTMLADFYAEQKRFAEAEALYLREIAIQERAMAAGNKDATLRITPDKLADIYKRENRLTESETLYRRVLASAEKAHGPDSPELLPILSKVTLLLSGPGETRDAEREAVLKRKLAITEKSSKPDSSDTVHPLVALADFYIETGRDPEAEPFLKSAIAVREKAKVVSRFDSLTASTAELMKKLAVYYSNLGRLDDADALFKRALTIVESKSGRDHRDVIPWLVSIGEMKAKQGKSAEAEEAFKRAIAIENRAMLTEGTDFFVASGAARELGALYKEQKRVEDHERFLKERLDVEERALIAGSQTRLATATDLYVFYREQGRDADREAVSKRELAAMEKAYGPEDPKIVSTLVAFAMFYDQQGRDAEAGAMRERALRIQQNALGPDHRDTISMLTTVAASYTEQKRYEDAERTYKEALAHYEKAARPDPLWLGSYEIAFDGLVRLYTGLGRVEEIDPLYRRAIALIDAKALAPADRNVAETYGRVVEFYRKHYRYADAMRVAQRWLAIKEKASDGELLAPLTATGILYQRQTRYAEAEPLLKRAMGIAEKIHGPQSEKAVDAMLAMAVLYRLQGRYGEAEPLNLRALSIEEDAAADRRSRSKNSPPRRTGLGRVAEARTSLAVLRHSQGRFSEAEETYKRAIDLDERDWGRGWTTRNLHSLGDLYSDLGRYAEAEPLLKRVLQLTEARTGGGEHIALAGPLQSLGELHFLQSRFAEAEPLLKRAAAISEKVNGPAYPTTLSILASLAQVYVGRGGLSEAETLMKQVAAGRAKVFGDEHPITVSSLQQLLLLHLRQDRLADAERIAARLRALPKPVRPGDQDSTFSDFLNARFEEKRGNWAEAWRLRKKGAAIIIAEARKQNAGGLGAHREGQTMERRSNWTGLMSLVRTAAEYSAREPARADELAAEAFEALQWARHSQAASALAQTSARFARGDGQLAVLVRKRQDLVSQFKAVDRDLVTSLSVDEAQDGASTERRDRQDQIWAERDGLDKAIQQVDAELKVKFPEYAALANPEPLSIKETQSQLKPGEALYQIMFDETAAYAWVVTPDAMRWRTLPIGGDAVAETVNALRCGLDSSAWDAPETTAATGSKSPDEASKDCRTLLGQTGTGRSLPFDLARAHQLYEVLFAPFEDLIRDKHLMVVQPGLIASLPLQVLVTEAPDPKLKGEEAYARAAWLALRQPVTVLPSVPSLKALRSAKRPPAERPYAGFGNPLLDGEDGKDRSAWDRKDCAVEVASLDTTGVAMRKASAGKASPAGVRGGVQSFYRGGLGDVSLIRRQQPLPETADEVCTVAKALGGGQNDVFLGAKASEGALKAMSKAGRLSTSRVVHFATHGLIGGETEILTRSRLEPALIMTPPDQATEDDDGLLTASEAAQLALNADLVILSACNTAAGDGRAGGEALSGLARAFLYAGSRALLASHWYVNSAGAVELVTGMFAETAREPDIGLAEALRRAMAARIQAGGPRAHPSYWAPFIIVGEGGRG